LHGQIASVLNIDDEYEDLAYLSCHRTWKECYDLMSEIVMILVMKQHVVKTSSKWWQDVALFAHTMKHLNELDVK
jgi:hypothetical protein